MPRPNPAPPTADRSLPIPLADSGVLAAWSSSGPSTVEGVAARLTALGRTDADLGWIGAVAAVANLAVAELPDEVRHELLPDGVPTLVCGTLAPQGTGAWTDEGFRVRAVSTPASGLPWAEWVMATVRDEDGGALVRVFVHVDQVRVETTWDAAGLVHSGGDTAHLEDVLVPRARTRVLGPLGAGAPLTFSATLFFAAPLLGVVEAELARAVHAVSTGGPRRERADVRSALSAAALLVARARALYAGAVDGLGTRDQVDALSPLDRATAAHLAVEALEAAEAALPLLVTATGAAALHADHPLARAVRDVGVGARHTALSPTKAALAHLDALTAELG